MKKLSQWASRHVCLAIFLIVIGEVANGFNGILLGASLLGNLPSACLYTASLVLISLAFFVQLQGTSTNLTNPYWVRRRWFFTAFLINFLLFGFLGGIWNQHIQHPHSVGDAFGGQRAEVIRDTIPQRLITKSTIKTDRLAPDPQAQLRTGYILLGVLGIILASLSTTFACGLLCTGYGFWAALTFFLGLGGIVGSINFFRRANAEPPKRRRDMTPEERKRDSRRIWLPWLVLIGLFSALFLIAGNK